MPPRVLSALRLLPAHGHPPAARGLHRHRPPAAGPGGHDGRRHRPVREHRVRRDPAEGDARLRRETDSEHPPGGLVALGPCGVCDTRARPVEEESPLGNGPGAPLLHGEGAADLRLVLRGAELAGECGPPGTHRPRDVPSARLLRPQVPVLAQCPDGARPHQCAPPLPRGPLPAGRRAQAGPPHAGVPVRRGAGPVLRHDHRQQCWEEGPGAGVDRL